MEQRPAYEHVIAGKLETLPVPDMADAIWARIETQLDMDLPTNDGGNDPAPQPPSGPGALGWGLSIVLVALLAAFLFYKKNKPQDQTSIPNAPVNTEQKTQPSPDATGPSRPAQTNLRPNTTAPKNVPVTGAAPRDTIVQQPMVSVPLQMPDSTGITTAPTRTNIPAPKDSAGIQKKKRGVTGIKDEDYRITPATRDSS